MALPPLIDFSYQLTVSRETVIIVSAYQASRPDRNNCLDYELRISSAMLWLYAATASAASL